MSIKNIVLLIICTLILCVSFPFLSHANSQPSIHTLNKISQFIPELTRTEHLDIEQIDLNEDGINEYIVRHPGCYPDQLCAYDVLADTGEEMLSLAHVEALKVEVGQHYTNGVRNILIFSNTANDFEYTLYRWNSTASHYEESSKQ